MNINKILKKQIELIKPNKDTLKGIKKTSDEFCKKLKEKLRKKKIKAEVFIGGSLAKKTIVKKDRYDVDIFVRFDRKYGNEEISKLLGKIIDKKAKRVHGSRDYYQQVSNGIIMEIIPVIKIKNQQEAQNITDLSYFHVNYINKIINKNKKLADEIILAKTFSHAQNCYGAESYVHGFSGYALELLICHYRSFLKFISSIASQKNILEKNSLSSKHQKSEDFCGLKISVEIFKSKKSSIIDRIIIDDAKFYKNNDEILRELNESKIQSPIILIDPTFKQRNALAGLSNETFNKFKKNCKKFLKNPSGEFFKSKNIKEELKRKYKDELIILEVKTSKQAGDIAGSKSKKFFEFFDRQLKREFEIKINEFDYDEKENLAYFFFVIGKKTNEIIKGPPVTNIHNLTRFKKIHKNAFIKNHIAYAKIKHDLSFKEFIQRFKAKEKNIIKEMSVKNIELIN